MYSWSELDSILLQSSLWQLQSRTVSVLSQDTCKERLVLGLIQPPVATWWLHLSPVGLRGRLLKMALAL